MSKAFKAKDAYALSRPGAKATMYLPPRCRFVIVVAGQSPSIIPITEAGNWTVDIPPEVLPTITEWPVLVMVVPKKHADIFQNSDPAKATEMVRQARATYANAAN